MKTLSLFLLMICFSFTIQAQTLEGNWVITIPCDCSDKGEITWQWQVKADDTYAVDINVDGTVEVTGKYWVDGNKITVQNDEGCTEKGTYEQLYGFKNFVENDQNGIRKIAFDNFTKKIENYDLSSLKTLDNDKAINDPSYLPSKVNPDILKLFDDVARNYNGNKSDKEVKEYSTKLIIQYVKILKGTSIYIQKMIE